ncbi:uncharacterized protein LOC142980702 [Anticarsia gemmatalis]|uniref:uncharacterized protein LOC142980702 n=1 Tax=Anticarsia gemmatalis TaxID=129554 RepID=UPI003F75E7B2
MLTFSADGVTTPPMIIYPLKRMRPELQKSVPSEWGIGLSDNGWMKAELFVQYIQNVLHPALIKNNITFPVILFLDGHKSHTTLQLTQLCQNLGIILIALYPNATRILQPADVAAFRPIKVMWRKAVLEWRTDNLSKSLLKTDVAPILEKLLPKLKKATLKNGFEACGLCPFNPDQVDYTKCLMPSKPAQDILDVDCSTSLNYQTFEEIIGPQLIRKMKNQVIGKSIEAKKLYDLYKYLVPKISIPKPQSQTIETTSMDLIHMGKQNLNEQNNDDFHAPRHETPPHVEVPHDEAEKLPLSPCLLISSINNSVPEAVQTVEVISECDKEKQTITPINVIPIPSTSRQRVELIEGNWVLVDDIPTEVPTTPIKTQYNINIFLKLPRTPIKTQKAGIEHRSFVLTRKDWEAVELEKQQKKMKEIQKKENKRIDRLDKARERRILKEKKQAETRDKKNKAKNLNLIKKSKPNLDNNRPKIKFFVIVIHSNVFIKPGNRVSSDIEEGRVYTRNTKEELVNEVKPANITALKEIKNRPILIFKELKQAQMTNKELNKEPILELELKPAYLRDSKETGKEKKMEEKRLRPMSNEELLKMLEEH